jgi:hypothetical protein
MSLRPEVAEVLAKAKSYIGTAEAAPHVNRGAQIDLWNKGVGNDLGAPWCAAFVYGVGHEVLGANWPVIRSGGCQDIYLWAKRKKVLVATPEAGDLFLIWHKELARYAHVGYIGVAEKDTIQTIEGNTNTDGSRDGWGVFGRTRAITDRLAFVRWSDLLA